MFHDDKLMTIERFDFNLGKKYLRDLLEWATIDYLNHRGKITQCRPAFAVGCEIRPAVRQAIRRGL
jgi:hypothetical protein